MILQRASAGSGKTYKLAKTYIRLFISTRDEGSAYYRLLTPAEVRDAHSHILGVTFTNKATNEMKQRIVEKLAALSKPVPAKGMEPADYKFPDYLLDFTGENPNADPVEDIIYHNGLPAAREEITATCKAALSSLLNNYSNFNISTIDSFFQNVMRTMAYELRINDTYHVELKDDYLAQVGVDDTLSSVKESAEANKREMGAFMSEWLKIIMNRRLTQGEKWDAFAKSRAGIYGKLLDIAQKMNKEDFKKHYNEAEMPAPTDFLKYYNGVLRASLEVKTLHHATVEKARLFSRTYSPTSYASGIATGLKSILTVAEFDKPDVKTKFLRNRSNDLEGPGNKNRPFKKGTAEYDNPAANEMFTELCDTLDLWLQRRAYWNAVLSHLHYLGSLYYINESINAFREENNIIPLSATNEILNKIIKSGGEVPFIYERIGVHLHHFLLDEFQDTSRLQWENIVPLLEESDSHSYENLIIGDAKQSIYRFRNAAPEIINSEVEAAFPGTCVLPANGSKGTPAYQAVNTNWRSVRHIVNFNNTLFSTLVELLDSEGDNIFRHLYDNVVQPVKKKNQAGYVRVNFTEKHGFDYLGPLIEELRDKRGYTLGDIAILTDSKKDGQHAIDAIISYNKSRTEESGNGYTPIEFISEESLLVGESPAVKVILSVMSLICRDFVVPGSTHDSALPSESPLHLRPYELERLVANYNIGLWLGTVKNIADIETLEGIITAEYLKSLRRMDATTLPALVEDIAATFLKDNELNRQAAHIAAFQDIVLQYCETFTPDLSSFLKWWEDNGRGLSIAAPEGIDAVQVMTIHKSKGLEFEVVIIPKADWVLAPTREKDEIIWSAHIPAGLTEEEQACAPKQIPITPDGTYMNTPSSPFYKDYHEFFLKSRVDQLNKTYVAFTRAVKELYIYAATSKKGSFKIGDYMKKTLDIIPMQNNDDANLMSISECNYDGNILEYGSPQFAHSDDKEREKASANEMIEDIVIDRYCLENPITTTDADFILADDE